MTAEPPSVKQLLAHDETIINPYYMRQLLEYGIKLGKESKGTELNSEALVREAEVRPIFRYPGMYINEPSFQRLVAELKSTVFLDASQ